jgi:uncharacterized protein GlcG (DUF336 family)
MQHHIKVRLGTSALWISLALPLLAPAQTPPPAAPAGPPAKRVPLALASEMAMTAAETCVALGYNVSATVVDAAGDVIIALRSDSTRAGLLDFSRRKAYTAAITKRKTSELLEISKQNPTSAELPVGDKFLFWSGGLPILANGELIGAIGVGGAPSTTNADEQCADAGLAKVRDRLK